MHSLDDLRTKIAQGGCDDTLGELYGEDAIVSQRNRYTGLLAGFDAKFSGGAAHFFSAPGRTELGGNHTDHNHGRVLAAGIQLDKVAAVSPREDNRVVLWTEGFEAPIDISLESAIPDAAEHGKPEALVRGVAARLQSSGLNTGGFCGYIVSDVATGSGLSSSASFEVLLGSIFDHLYNDGDTDPVVLAQAGQYAENEYFGKPCGLMDQTACAVGGIISIDFADPSSPDIEQVAFDFSEHGYELVVVDTGGHHADLTPDYAAVPQEMKALAAALGKQVCREITDDVLLANIPRLREEVGDRAILRGLHFLADNDRVTLQIDALKDQDVETYLDLVRESGDSSWKVLQNVYSPRAVDEQGVTLGLTLASRFLKGHGACRVQGGGFAGTMQAYVPTSTYPEFAQTMRSVFGPDAVSRLRVRQEGVCKVA